MTALPFAASRLARSTLTGSNGSALQRLCSRCPALAQQQRLQRAGSLLTEPVQRQYSIQVRWGNRQHVPNVQVRKSKRQRLADAAKKGEPIAAPQLSQDELKDVYASDLFVFRSDLASGKFVDAMQALENLVDLDILQASDTLDLARALHQAYRSKAVHYKAALQYLQTIIGYLRTGDLPTHYLAQVHILSTAKEMECWWVGNDYWKWLKTQGTEYLDARVFGAVIEYLAYQGAPLPELEQLHQLALEKFSTFEDEGGGTQHRATRLMLLQGILTARVLHHDWKGMYQLLDVCARLHPTEVPTRIYEVVIHNRPAEEAYLIFMMACRAGTKLSPGTVMALATNWWKTLNDGRGVFQAFLAHFATGGKVTLQILNKIIFTLLDRLPEAPEPPPLPSLSAADSSPTEQTDAQNEQWQEWNRQMLGYQQAVNPVFETVRRTIEMFRGLGVQPNIITYNNIISPASKRHLQNIVISSMVQAEKLVESGLDSYEESSIRVALGAYADLRDKEGVKRTWEHLVAHRREMLERTGRGGVTGRTWAGKPRSNKPGNKDHELISWKALIRGCFKADMKAYVLEQLQKYESEFHHSLVQDIREELQRSEGKLQHDIMKRQKAEQAALNAGADTSGASATVKEVDYTSLKDDIEEYNRILGLMEKVVLSPTVYDFTNLGLAELKVLNLPDIMEQDVGELKEVYEHFQTNMPRNPYLTATHDPKTDLAGLGLSSKQPEEQAEEQPKEQPESAPRQTDGAWGENRSITGYTINQLRFENWLTINRAMFLAEKRDSAAAWRRKASIGGTSAREQKARDLIRRMEGLEGQEWESEALKVRLELARGASSKPGKLPVDEKVPTGTAAKEETQTAPA